VILCNHSIPDEQWTKNFETASLVKRDCLFVIYESNQNDIMALLETVHLSHLPQSTPFHVALYRDIKNASFLREQLISGNIDFQYAFIDATVVCLIPFNYIYIYS
jgi:hypothetical protein